jgi:acyl-CoA synthetase (AMP-forming)/AMP-acid ligase II
VLRLTAADARARASAAGVRLAQAGLVAGDRIAIAPAHEGDRLLAQRQQRGVIAAMWGALSIGVIPVMVNPDLSERERGYILTDSAPSLIFDSTAALEELSTPDVCLPGLPPFPLGRPMHYSSGTTGKPKGVWSGVLSAEQAEGLWGTELTMWGCSSNDVSLVHGPLSHSGPLRFALYTLLAGGDVVLPGHFDAEAHAAALIEFRPSIAFVVPSHMQRLLELGDRLPPSPYRMLVHAGAACPAVVKQAMHNWAGAECVWEFYGSTEGQFTTMPGTQWSSRPGSVGQARSDREIRVIDGVIWCAAPDYGYFEYWGEPDKTAAAWQELEGQRWFTVGDLGRLDSEGYLYIDGRRDDLIISGGMNVYPAEIEAEILAFEGVRDVAVFGVSDPRWGQRVCAAVVGEVDVDALSTALRSSLAGYKRPKEIFTLTELPRTASGKVQRLKVAPSLGLE